MNTRRWIAANVAVLMAATLSLPAAETTRFDARPGSQVRVEGTSSVHDWRLVGTIIGGFIEVGPNFPTEPGQTVQPGKVDAKVEAFIPVRSLASKEKDGKPYSKKMDDIVYENLKVSTQDRIVYTLDELVLKEMPKSKEAPYVFDSKGSLAVAGVTNKIAMVVNILPMADKKMKITGQSTLKMTDFKINPPAPALAMGLIKTADEVKIIIDWNVGHKPAAAAAK